MENNNFRTCDHLISKIKEDFSSYDNSGLIDSGRFYTDIKYILNRLGVKWYIDIQDFIHVENYKVELPDGFHQLDFAYKCAANKNTESNVVMTRQTFDHYPLLELDWHKDPCNGCGDNCYTPPPKCIFNAYERILVECDNEIHCYSNPVLLKLGNVNTQRQCKSGCVNIFSTSTDTITIQNNNIYTNFERGTIYISYVSFPLDVDTGLPLIPNNSKVEKCIEDYIKYNLIKMLATNKDADVSNLISLYKQDYLESLGVAITETKMPSFNSMVNMIRRNRNRFNIYQQI